jgi:hypothetical protein
VCALWRATRAESAEILQRRLFGRDAAGVAQGARGGRAGAQAQVRLPPVKMLLTVALLAFLFGIFAGAAFGIHAQEIYTAEDTLAAIQQYSDEIGVSYSWLYRIVRCETGWTFDPYSVGRHGELGAAQLAPWGELLRFYAWGYDQPFSPYQSVRFLAQRLSMGGAKAWSCA